MSARTGSVSTLTQEPYHTLPVKGLSVPCCRATYCAMLGSCLEAATFSSLVNGVTSNPDLLLRRGTSLLGAGTQPSLGALEEEEELPMSSLNLLPMKSSRARGRTVDERERDELGKRAGGAVQVDRKKRWGRNVACIETDCGAGEW